MFFNKVGFEFDYFMEVKSGSGDGFILKGRIRSTPDLKKIGREMLSAAFSVGTDIPMLVFLPYCNGLTEAPTGKISIPTNTNISSGDGRKCTISSN